MRSRVLLALFASREALSSLSAVTRPPVTSRNSFALGNFPEPFIVEIISACKILWALDDNTNLFARATIVGGGKVSCDDTTFYYVVEKASITKAGLLAIKGDPVQYHEAFDGLSLTLDHIPSNA